MISKENFVKAINDIKKHNDFADELYGLFEKYDMDPPIIHSPLQDTILNLLSEEFKLETNTIYGNDIDYFCYELDYGEKWEPGMITDIVTGEDIDFSSADKLYDYLLSVIDD